MITITDKLDGQKKLRRSYEDYIPLETQETEPTEPATQPEEPATQPEEPTETTTETTETHPETAEPATEPTEAEN